MGWKSDDSPAPTGWVHLCPPPPLPFLPPRRRQRPPTYQTSGGATQGSKQRCGGNEPFFACEPGPTAPAPVYPFFPPFPPAPAQVSSPCRVSGPSLPRASLASPSASLLRHRARSPTATSALPKPSCCPIPCSECTAATTTRPTTRTTGPRMTAHSAHSLPPRTRMRLLLLTSGRRIGSLQDRPQSVPWQQRRPAYSLREVGQPLSLCPQTSATLDMLTRRLTRVLQPALQGRLLQHLHPVHRCFHGIPARRFGGIQLHVPGRGAPPGQVVD